MSDRFGKGAIKDRYDIRNFQYKAPRAGLPFDWNKGFDIEEKIGARLVTKDQDGSYSCGGQAWAYYGEVLEAVATGTYEPRSARWIYSYTHVSGGGSNGKDNSDFCVNKGWALEKNVLSYDNGHPPSERFMITKPAVTQAIIEDTEVDKALSYLQVNANIDLFAQAIQENNGMVLGVDGQDNGTWLSLFPKPPAQKVWAHWLYAGKAKLINGKKYIGVKNSWGPDAGEDGWQWIGEDYFKTGNVWKGWTLAWDYEPPKKKQLMIQIVRLYKALIAFFLGQRPATAAV